MVGQRTRFARVIVGGDVRVRSGRDVRGAIRAMLAAMSGRFARVGQIACGVLLAGSGVQFGETYIRRLPNHAGYFVVAVEDRVEAPPARPRHTVVVVADGLGAAFAREMTSARRLQAAGQCRVTDVGPISVSRPVYAVISSGLEQDRTGARNNDETSPLAVESIWEVAREAGLEVVWGQRRAVVAAAVPARL